MLNLMLLAFPLKHLAFLPFHYTQQKQADIVFQVILAGFLIPSVP